MALFAIIRSETAINNDALAAALAKKYPNNFYKLGKGQWIIHADATVRELSADLGIEKGKHFGGTLIVEISDYFGLHDKKLWNWMKERQAEQD